jgi:NAD(P)-dependent dehydrogenase (short-subunit alcohol dehydrogenase family)
MSAPPVSPRALEGHSIVVIGGTTGLGLSASLAFAREGARLVVVGLLGADAAAARESLGTTIAVLEGDATHAGTAVTAIERAVGAFGRLDGLYHVAGGSGRRWGDGPLHEMTEEGWRATVELNLTSVFLSNRAAVQQFLGQDAGGVVVNLASVLAWSPSPRHFATHAYATAKAGIIGLTRAAAAAYAPHGIRFNAIAPGLVDTPMAQRAARDDAIMADVRARQPLDGGRIGHPSDVDGAAVYLMSDAARFVTGQVIAVDGGWSVTGGAAQP